VEDLQTRGKKESIRQPINYQIFILKKNIFAYIPRYHSPPKQVSIKSERVTVLHNGTNKLNNIKSNLFA